MKKTLILLITIILLTGCSAKYEINITEDKIIDTITISTKSTNVNNATDKQTDNFTKKLGEWENGHDYYKRQLITTDELTSYEYTYDFTYEEYDVMSQIRRCYDDFAIENSTYTIIKTSNHFLCKEYYDEIKDIEITITSDYEIISSNADTKENNIHTWKINNTNYKNKPLEIKVNKNVEYIEEIDKDSSLIPILTITLFFILIIVLIIRKRKEASTK